MEGRSFLSAVSIFLEIVNRLDIDLPKKQMSLFWIRIRSSMKEQRQRMITILSPRHYSLSQIYCKSLFSYDVFYHNTSNIQFHVFKGQELIYLSVHATSIFLDWHSS